jgi:ATP-dependent RNA helicase SUPV3L1/SUV3
VEEPSAPLAVGATETAPEEISEPQHPAEPETIEVWRPAPAHPKRSPRKPRTAGEPQAERQREGQEPRRRPGKERRAEGKRRSRPGEREAGERRQWQQRPPREREVDPDSPFAALQALKKELEESRRE